MAKITIVIEEGKVRRVDGIPDDVYLEVRNYDVRRFDEKLLSEDENGRPCQILEWHAPE